MATSFPTGLDALTNPTSGNTLASPDHAGQHADANDAIEALEAKVGVNGSAVTSSLDYKITNINASNLTSGTVPTARVAGSYTNITSVGTLSSLNVSGSVSSGGITTSVYYRQDTDYLSPYQGFRNKIINGDFGINQRAFTSITASDTYGFDRWAFQASGGTSTMTPQTFTVGSPAQTGYESANFCRLATSGQTLTGHYSILYQKIEDVRTFANSTVTVSFWAKAASGNPKIALEFGQVFGTGGSPSAGVNTYAGQATISTSWARYSITATVPSISGKTIGTTANTSLLGINFWVSAGSTFNSRTGSIGLQNNTFDIWGVQVERGSVATPFEQRPIGTELALCQRYYWRHTGFSSGPYFGGGTADATSGIYITVQHPVPMRVAPTSIDVVANITDTSATFTPTAISIYLAGTLSTTIKNTYSSYVQYRWHAYLLNNAGYYVGCSSEL